MFLSIDNLILFLTATLTLNFIPGNDVLYVASQSLQSKAQGLLAALGTGTGGVIWVIATAFGLSQVLNHVPWLFNLIKLVGAAYLLYLAGITFFKKEKEASAIVHVNTKRCQSYYKGIATNLLNPKVGLFFVTFLPQFVVPHHGKAWSQLMLLGVIFITSGTIVNILYALLFHSLREKLFSKLRFQRWLNKITASIFCLLALKIIIDK